ncbi:MAG: glycoside hydrolase family 88 protein [Prevotella sp.]|nr:glycoside hydrolase family 88 protein [Prevotella sp.]
MRKMKLMLLCLLMPMIALADNWDAATYQQIEKSVQEPTFANRSFLITKYGASEKATAAKNQKAINKAIDECSKKGGGKVIVPAGTFETGPITLKSNVNLEIQKDGKLLFAFDQKLFPIVLTRWEGMDCMNYQPCIYAYGEKNIAITGEGTIDGNGSNDTWWKMCGKDRFGWTPDLKESQKIGRPLLFEYSEAGKPFEERNMKDTGLRPQLINLYKCDNVAIKDVTLLRSPFWVIHPLICKNLLVKGVKIWNEGPNGDGCDPESCENVIIEDCEFHTGDDCIAIKSGRNADGRIWNLPSKNIIVRNCTMEDGHGGVVVGSEITGGCQNVFVENCKMDSPNLDRVLRIKTNTCRGGIIENIYMRDVTVGQCKESVMRINLGYEPNEPAKRGFIPTVRNVYMSNVTCQKSQFGIKLNGLDEADNIYNINVENCQFNGVSIMPVERTGKSHNVNFNNLFVNGNLILAQKPYKNYSEWMTHSEMTRVPHSYLLDFPKNNNPRWSYTSGTEMGAMFDTYMAYKDESILNYLKEYPAEMIDANGNAKGYKYEDFNLDNVRPGKVLFDIYQLDPKEKDLKLLQTLFKQLEKQPRTKEGVFWHKAIYAYQVWLDGIFMGLPYYTKAAKMMKGDKKAIKVYDDAVDQIVKTDKRTYDAKTGLWKHAWDETHTQFWANPETGLSQHTWARAMGWYTMAMIEVLDNLPENYARRQEVIDIFKKAMTALVKCQDEKTGVWYDVLDVKDPRNYLESTASSMFAYCLLKGYRKGYLDASFRDAGVKAYNGILKQFIKVNADKTISLTQCCEVSGLGPGVTPVVLKAAPNVKENKRRDGSFEYYMSEPIRDNDGKGVGPFIWASLEMEQQGLPIND